MTVATIDNASDTELNRTITWQFDNATKLVGIIQSLKDFFTQSTKNLWDGIVPNVEDIDTANDYGLAVWGKILGVNRPVLTSGQTQTPLSSSIYRKLLKGRFALLNGNTTLGIVGNGSVDDYCKYVNYIFGGLITVTDGLDMSLTFSASNSLTGELKNLFDNHKDSVFIYPCGVKDNVLSNSLRFKLTQTNTPDAAFISANHAGSLNNSSFTWN